MGATDDILGEHLPRSEFADMDNEVGRAIQQSPQQALDQANREAFAKAAAEGKPLYMLIEIPTLSTDLGQRRKILQGMIRRIKVIYGAKVKGYVSASGGWIGPEPIEELAPEREGT